MRKTSPPFDVLWTPTPETLDEPLRARKPRKILVADVSDQPFEFIAAVYGVMAACPQNLFIILTKRPKRMREFFEWVEYTCNVHDDDPVQECANHAHDVGVGLTANFVDAIRKAGYWPLPNVIHGYSAANQADLDAGVGDLLATPSALRCLSLEPLIGPIIFADEWMYDSETVYGLFPGGDPRRFTPDGSECSADEIARHKEACAEWDAGTGKDRGPSCASLGDGSAWNGKGFGIGTYTMPGDKLDWVITGGESGPGARPCDIEWIRSIVEQCKAVGVRCFVKQVGSNPTPIRPMRLPAYSATTGKPLKGWYGDGHETIQDRKGADPAEWPQDINVRQYPEVKHV